MIWSLTPFFNELDVLEIRLATLDPVVDRHVICESTRTHTGFGKPLHYAANADRYERWADKIVHVIVDDMLPALTPADEYVWTREKHQRRKLLDGIRDAQAGDTFLLSDVDEIPHPDAVRVVGEAEHLRCHMHVGRLNWRWPGEAEEGFTISRLFPAQELLDAGGDLEVIRMGGWSSRPEAPVGWHLAYMADIDEKLAGFAHQEMTAVATAELQAACIATGADLFGREERHAEWVGLDQLPPYVGENVERFQHMLVPQPKESGP